MKELIVRDFKECFLNSDTLAEEHYRLTIPENVSASLVVVLEGSREAVLNLDVTVGQGASFKFLTINHNEAGVTLNENYDLLESSEAVIAHAELNKAETVLNSSHYLKEGGADLQVNTAVLSSTKKTFNQDSFHKAGNTSAHVNNYGVVLADGHCDLIVRNTIEKGCHGSATHQSSRLLTYDKSAIAKILPVLYIYDNDVEASHAASLGQPDDEQLYYLETRGISRNEALKLVASGYLMPITRVIDDEKIVEALVNEIEEKVAEGCSM